MKIHYTETLKRIAEARRLCQPTKEDWTSLQYRRVSIFLSVLLARSDISANQVTAASILVGTVGIIALACANYWIRLGGAILILFSELLDFVDGELARLKRHTSTSGVFLDALGFDLIKRSMFLAVGYQVFHATNNVGYLLLAFSASIFVQGYLMAPIFAEYANPIDQRRGEVSTECAQRSLLRTCVRPIFFLMRQTKHLIFVATIFNGTQWVLLYYGFVAPVLFLWRVWRIYRRLLRTTEIALKADARR